MNQLQPSPSHVSDAQAHDRHVVLPDFPLKLPPFAISESDSHSDSLEDLFRPSIRVVLISSFADVQKAYQHGDTINRLYPTLSHSNFTFDERIRMNTQLVLFCHEERLTLEDLTMSKMSYDHMAALIRSSPEYASEGTTQSLVFLKVELPILGRTHHKLQRILNEESFNDIKSIVLIVCGSGEVTEIDQCCDEIKDRWNDLVLLANQDYEMETKFEPEDLHDAEEAVLDALVDSYLQLCD
ncbi:uncharacterized protein BT62DRAFT_1013556 [Guyanagaster necrorhizus]|uniref:Uncharacterized protein n=1 Tax=Guyanagaster necrorhizus TaxID=856835 RepID=A0A9P8ALK6_9AGAR|nr:uncharacterized protein BT62DRAFT_1013556 [Guyanagaster necrorhizus MCA 3950]KAG7439746.1 hypothetical protein BT62DRAFT_1013556 [Guyanagaster necrorhizus MCA 3950]